VSRGLAAIALVAGASLALEVLLTRLLAIIHWHDFATMVISLALLGYGASGSVLSLVMDRVRPHADLAFAGAATLFGISAITAVAAAQAVPFNALEVIWTPRQWLWLALLYLLFAVPFFFAASCMAVALACFPAALGRIYRFDLLGAGAGALLVVGLLSILRPDRALPLIGALGPLAAALVLARSSRRLAALAVLTAAGLVGVSVAGWPTLRASPFKPLSQTLLIEGTKIIAERTSPIGLVDVVQSAWIPFRSAVGLSLMNRQEPAAQLGLFVDGHGPSPITAAQGDPALLAYLDATLGALPYRLVDRPRVLLLGLGGGTDLLVALRHAASQVDVVEPDSTVADLLRGELATFAGNILDRPEVRVQVDAARRFAAAAASSYQLILLDPHATGRSTLAEDFTTTVQGFAAYLSRLAPEGLLALPHPLRLPPRDSFKLVLTAIRALDRLGIKEPEGHLALLRSWDSVLLLVGRTPLGADRLGTIDRFAEELGFDVGWHPRIHRSATDRFNILGAPVYFDGIAALVGPDRSRFVADYAFDIRPATDDRPYFLDFFRWRALPSLWSTARQGNAGLLDWGWPVQLVTLGVAVLFALVLILVPAGLTIGATAGGLMRPVAAYFLLIGFGFMFIEIATLQRVVLLLGHPVYAFAVTLAAFLIFAGLGAGTATRLERARPTLAGQPWGSVDLVVIAIVLLAATVALVVPRLLETVGELSAVLRSAIVLALIAPLAFTMGMPFPLVLARLRLGAPQLLPWAWGVNGCASVIGAVLAGIVAMSFGTLSLSLLAIGAYALAAVAQRGIVQHAGISQGRPAS
jgi:hypothetical protein